MGSAGVGNTTTLPAVRALPDNCSCVHSICCRHPVPLLSGSALPCALLYCSLASSHTNLYAHLPLSLHPNFTCMHVAVYARSTAPPCLLLLANVGLLSRSSRPTHLWSQNPAHILVPTRPRCTTSEGPWLNPDLVGKWSHSPAKALSFLQKPSQNPSFPSTSPVEHHPNPEPFFQSSLFQFH